MRTILNNLKKFWNDRQNFAFLLSVLLIYIFAIIPLVNGRLIGELLFFIFYFLLLSTGIPFLIRNRKAGVILLLTITPFVLLFSELILKYAWLTISADIFIALYCICLGTIIFIRTFAKGHVNLHRVQGAIVVYLLISFVFAMIFHSIYLVNGKVAFNGLGSGLRTEFMYFSLTTLTTVGYGDIAPVNVFARSLSNFEALIGQLYPAILIARLVSMEFTSSKDK